MLRYDTDHGTVFYLPKIKVRSGDVPVYDPQKGCRNSRHTVENDAQTAIAGNSPFFPMDICALISTLKYLRQFFHSCIFQYIKKYGSVSSLHLR